MSYTAFFSHFSLFRPPLCLQIRSDLPDCLDSSIDDAIFFVKIYFHCLIYGTENKINASIETNYRSSDDLTNKEEIMFKKIICMSLIALLVLTMTPAVSAADLMILPTIATKESVGTSGDAVMLYNFLNRK